MKNHQMRKNVNVIFFFVWYNIIWRTTNNINISYNLLEYFWGPFTYDDNIISHKLKSTQKHVSLHFY